MCTWISLEIAPSPVLTLMCKHEHGGKVRMKFSLTMIVDYCVGLKLFYIFFFKLFCIDLILIRRTHIVLQKQ
jgi:hypothetical protein